MDQAIEQFCREHSSHRIKTPQHQPKISLGMTHNDCVDNATDYATLYPDWQFCAGWMLDGDRLLAHCWNRKRNKHRDVTPFYNIPPTVYVESPHWTQQVWQACQEWRAGNLSRFGFIHPCYQYNENHWIKIPNSVNEKLIQLL